MATAAILAGGYGKRLRPLTHDTPKPLLTVGSKPILMWQIELLRRYSVDNFVLCVGYRKESIKKALGDGSSLGVSISYAEEEEPLGTGGAIKNARRFLESEEYFFVLNGDILTNLDPTPLTRHVGEHGLVASIALVKLPSPYGIVYVGENDLVDRFVEKPLLPFWINAGVYCFSPEVFDYLPDKGDLERTTLPLLAEKKLLAAVRYKDVYWRSIDTHKDLDEARKEVSYLERSLGS